MASQFSNLSFWDRADRRRWKVACEDARRIAKQWPAYHPRMIMVEEYQRRLGPWRTIFCLETYLPRPCWTGSASILEQVAERRIVIPSGRLKGGYFDAPDDDYLMVKQWEPQHFEQARFLLAELFGELIRPGDNNQRCEESQSDHLLVWRVPFEGPKYWMERQN